jgi:hypothetical protein
MQNQYATGKTTYFGGLPNSQSGTKNPTGYIEREQRRSGLAQVALAKQRNQPQPTVMPEMPTPVETNYKRMLNRSGLFVSGTGKIGRIAQ